MKVCIFSPIMITMVLGLQETCPIRTWKLNQACAGRVIKQMRLYIKAGPSYLKIFTELQSFINLKKKNSEALASLLEEWIGAYARQSLKLRVTFRN